MFAEWTAFFMEKCVCPLFPPLPWRFRMPRPLPRSRKQIALRYKSFRELRDKG